MSTRKGMKKKTIIYGNGEFAHHVHQNIIDQGELEISAFTADRAFIKERTIRGLPVVDFEEVEKNLSPRRIQHAGGNSILENAK